jgi:hypothetical protein
VLSPIYGQKLSTSPYSFYGIGEKGGLDNATFAAFGNNHAGIMDSTILNYYNPSTYNLLSKGQPLFSFGISSRLSLFKQGDRSEFNMTSSLQHIVMAFPVRKHFGLAFGLKPFSSRGYNFYSGQSLSSTDSIVYNYVGSGNTNEVFLGLSSTLVKYNNSWLSVGMNAGYVFGETKNTRRSYIHSSTAQVFPGGIDQRASRLSTFHYDLGLYFNQKFRQHNFTLSAIIEPAQTLRGTFDYGLYFSSSIDDELLYDTLLFETSTDNVTTGLSYELGLTYVYQFRDSQDKARKTNSQLLLATSYGMTDWESFSAPFNDSLELLNARKLTFGIQFTPEVDLFSKSSTLKFYQKLHYRAGAYLNTTPYSANNQQLGDKGITFGIGIPVSTLKSLSSINLGFAIGNRGTGIESTLNESYYGINLGITIAPGITERWFRNPKLN